MTWYTVRPGDCLSKIAAAHGFKNYRTIYDHPNNAAFRKKRPNPNVIMAGDVLFIPSKDPKVFHCETGRRHTLVAKGAQAFVAVYVLEEDQPLAGERYALVVEGQTLTGKTDAAGLVRQPVPPAASSAVLRFPDSDLEILLQFGALDPLGEPSGVQQRLANLGYLGSGGELSQALQRFQSDRGLSPTGAADEATIRELREYHDRGALS